MAINKTTISSGKRKRAIAKAKIRTGTGKVRVNRILLENYSPKMAQMKLQEPLILAEDNAKRIDIDVTVRGGGITGQTEAARLAIAKGLVAFLKNKKLEKTFLDYDRHLLVADIRRKEVRKPNTHGKARAKVAKSYR